MSDHPIEKPQSGTADVDPGARDVKSKTESKTLNQCRYCKRILISKQILEEHYMIHEQYGHGRSPKKTPKKTWMIFWHILSLRRQKSWQKKIIYNFNL